MLQKNKQLKGADPLLRANNLTEINSFAMTGISKIDPQNSPEFQIFRAFRISSEFFHMLSSERLFGVRFTVLNWAGATRLKGTTHLS